MEKKYYSLLTPAKINLFLDIVGKLPNGYHEINTIFYPLQKLHDEITLEITKTPELSLNVLPNILPTNNDNICLRAANEFAKATNTTPCWKFSLTKNIPIAAGCGGGSSDAAAVLKLLNNYYEKPLTEKKLHEIAKNLGADVPFFLNPQTSLATGIGEILTPIAFNKQDLGILLINPEFPVSAAWSYKNFTKYDFGNKAQIQNIIEAMATGDLQELKKNCYNIFDHCLLNKFPLLQIIFNFLHENNASCVHISGSGPIIFVIDELKKLDILRTKLNENFDHIWTHIE